MQLTALAVPPVVRVGWFCLLLCVWLPATAAADWPQFRGPSANGHAPAMRLPLAWDQDNNVIWRQLIPGRGHSSPVLVGSRLFVTTAVEQGDRLSLRLIALDTNRGNIVWDQEVFSEPSSTASRIHAKNSHASPTPLVDGQRIFVHFGHQGTACLDWAGRVVWRNDQLRYSPVHGNGGTPILVGQHLIFSCDGASDPFVVALDRDTGDVVWRVARETDAAKKFSFHTPAVIEVAGQPQVISAGSNRVSALDPVTGQEIWFVRYDGYSVIPQPVYANGLVVVCTGYDRPHLMAIRPTGSGDVTDSHVAWTVDRGVPNTPSVLVDGKLLFMVSDRGIASCLNAMSGETLWQERIGGNFSASPILVGDRIYLINEAGEATVIEAAAQFQELASSDLKEATLASPAVHDGSLYLRTDKAVYRIGNSSRNETSGR